MPKGIYKRKPFSEEHRKRISKALKGRMPKFIPNNKGRKLSSLSEEHKKKISQSLKGRKPYEITDSIREKMSLIRKGKPSNAKGRHWKVKDTSNMKGKKCSEETKRKMSEAHKKNPVRYWLDKTGDNSPTWKGENGSYNTKHKWIHKIKGKPLKCENCGKEGFYYQRKNGTKMWGIWWSNIDKKYTRNPDDYRGLCIPCHKEYDLIQAV